MQQLPSFSSLDVYAHAFNHRFFKAQNHMDVASVCQRDLRVDFPTFLPFDFDFSCSVTGNGDDNRSVMDRVDKDIFGIAEEVALAVLEGSEEDTFDDAKPQRYLLSRVGKNMAASYCPQLQLYLPNADGTSLPAQHHPMNSRKTFMPRNQQPVGFRPCATWRNSYQTVNSFSQSPHFAPTQSNSHSSNPRTDVLSSSTTLAPTPASARTACDTPSRQKSISGRKCNNSSNRPRRSRPGLLYSFAYYPSSGHLL